MSEREAIAFPATIKRSDIDYWNKAVAERDAALRQNAVLREALKDLHQWAEEAETKAVFSAPITAAKAVLANTEAAAQAYEREVRNRVLDEAAKICEKQELENMNARDAAPTEEGRLLCSGAAIGVSECYRLINALKETP